MRPKTYGPFSLPENYSRKHMGEVTFSVNREADKEVHADITLRSKSTGAPSRPVGRYQRTPSGVWDLHTDTGISRGEGSFVSDMLEKLFQGKFK